MASSGLRKSNFVPVVAQKQRTHLWRKRVVDIDGGRETIGGPVLIETTHHRDFLDQLPDAGPSPSDLSPNKTQSPPSTLNPKLMKELPIISIENDDEHTDPRDRPVSEVPTASSVYTRPSPELPFEFDPASQVPPLFSGKSYPVDEPVTVSEQPSTAEPQQTDEISRNQPTYPPRLESIQNARAEPLFEDEQQQQDILSPSVPLDDRQDPSTHLVHDSYETYDSYDPDDYAAPQTSFTERARLAGITNLGIDTYHSGQYYWQGASGHTRQLTPITATPVTMSGAGSISPIDSKDGGDYFPYHPTDEQPTPKAEVQPSKQFTEETPISSIEETPKQSVEPPSTPQNNSFFPQVPDLESPDSRASPENRQPQVSRFSWTTHATESPKQLVNNTPKTDRSRDSWTSQSPPQYYYRSQLQPQPEKPVQTSTRADLRNSGQGHDPYGRAFTYPGVRYITQPQTPPGPPPTTTIRSSPQSNIEDPMPQSRSSSIMSRAHPMAALTKLSKPPAQTINNPKNLDKSKMIKRKPTPSMMTTETPRTSTDQSTIAPSDKDKTLPITPATLGSIDHITLLQSDMSALALRKHNLKKRITHLNEIFSPSARINPMSFDLTKRRETKNEIAKLQSELAEVHRAERDTGLRLMRAQRRRDQEAPTALWVRRVTSVSD